MNKYDELADLLSDGLANALVLSDYDGDSIEDVRKAADVLRNVGELVEATADYLFACDDVTEARTTEAGLAAEHRALLKLRLLRDALNKLEALP